MQHSTPGGSAEAATTYHHTTLGVSFADNRYVFACATLTPALSEAKSFSEGTRARSGCAASAAALLHGLMTQQGQARGAA